MSKYEPLGQFLKQQKHEFVPMTFSEIERVLHSKLPNSKKYPAWWSNNPSNNVMTKQWLDAGYETESVDIERGKLVFRRKAAAVTKISDLESKFFFGSLKSMITLAPDFDPTEPTGMDWTAAENGGTNGQR